MIPFHIDEKLLNRKSLLSKYSMDSDIIEELLKYTENAFTPNGRFTTELNPLPDEIQIKDWVSYLAECDEKPAFEVLREKWVKLNLPIQERLSTNEEYLNVILKGKDFSTVDIASGLEFRNPLQIEMKLISGIAGSIPVIIIENDDDFISILQAMIYNNEPVSIPHSMGASIVKGINNWDRLRKAANQKQQTEKDKTSKEILNAVIKNTSLYQDIVIIASKKAYSSIHPSVYSTQEWIDHSVEIRIAHEYAHYMTHRFFNSMRNNMHDELLADYMGIHSIKNIFDASLFLKFIGLEDYPKYRKGGRLENYKGSPPLSDDVFWILSTIMYKAANHVQKVDEDIMNEFQTINTDLTFWVLSQFSLDEIASDQGLMLILKAYRHYVKQ